MYALQELFKHAQCAQAEINGKWVPARPMIGSWLHRLKDAWQVLRGRADAVTWPEGQ